jgi:rod shape determining protein RodA
MIDARLRKNFDGLLVLLALVVIVIGIVTLYSATGDSPRRFYQKQIIWALLGLGGMIGVASIDYNRYLRIAGRLYGLNLMLLGLVLFVGNEAKGATRWITIGSFQFQPSEFAKLFLIICLAVYLVRRQEHICKAGVLFGSFLYMAVPILLIFKQPDLGTSLVLVAIWFGMTFMAGARWWHLLLFLIAGVLLFAGMWHLNILKDYQKNRLVAFLNPEADPKDAGYHVLQSRIAIGSGQVWGKGFRKGTQVQGKFIPESHTDFIFTVIGEEGGFVVSTLLVLLYSGILFRGVLLIAQAEDNLGRLLATGVVCMYAFHIVVNLGMTIGIMPVTGVPLPLCSYGGSNLLLNLAAIGLLLSVGMRRHRLVF